jgi:branched-chain amino acid transport system substrate-binding protein
MHRVPMLVAVLLCLAALTLGAPVLAAEPVRIGAVLSVTGPASFLGEPERNTLLMLQDQLNAKGGILGRPVEVVVYDDESDVNKAVLAADKLLKKDRVSALIGASISGNTLAIMDKAAKAQVPLVSLSAAEKIVRPVNPWVFKTPQSDRHAVARILDHARKQGYRRLAVLTVSDGYGQAGREVLKDDIPAGGFELVADEVYGPRDTDMTPQLTKLKGLSPDAIICWGTNPGPAVVAKNRVQLGMATPLYMSHGVASKKFIELAGEAAEGLVLPAGTITVADRLPDAHPQKALLLAYIKDYQARFNAPVSPFGGYGWDGLMLVVKAIEMGKSDKPADIRDNLEKITGFVGITGVFRFTRQDHLGLDASSFEIVRIAKGDWQLVQ